MSTSTTRLPYEPSDDEPGAAPLAPIAKLTRDIRRAGAVLDRGQARYLVDLYYELQEHRIALDHQYRTATKEGEPADVVAHFAEQMRTLEGQAKGALDAWSAAHPLGDWMRAQKGVGPVIAAGFLAHLDVDDPPRTVGSWWAFAGLDPTRKWERGTKRPWNAKLKVLQWKLGDSFVKVSNRDDALYGQLYRQRKDYEVNRDEAGGNADIAAQTLLDRKIKDEATREVYESGHLPAGRLDLRARRWTTKMFLSHLHHRAWEHAHGEAPPVPFALAHQGHAHFIEPPPPEVL